MAVTRPVVLSQEMPSQPKGHTAATAVTAAAHDNKHKGGAQQVEVGAAATTRFVRCVQAVSMNN